MQYALLATCAELRGRGLQITQSELAARSRIDPMTTSQVVRALAARGLVEREVDPLDARARLLVPTEAGLRLLERAADRVRAVDAGFFGALGRDEPRLRTLLERLAEATAP